jgi:hypothetical protein
MMNSSACHDEAYDTDTSHCSAATSFSIARRGSLAIAWRPVNMIRCAFSRGSSAYFSLEEKLVASA